MKPVTFPGVNVIIAKDQPEYLPLPAIVLEGGEVITCWELSDEELLQLIDTKRIYLSQLTFSSPLQPILPSVNLEDYF